MSERASGVPRRNITQRGQYRTERKEKREGGSKEGETERVPRRIGIGGETHATV